MKKQRKKALLTVAGFAFLFAIIGAACKPIIPLMPPIPSITPTFTPTVTPGCQTSGFTTIGGSGLLMSPAPINLSTPVPTPTWTWTGTLPPHPQGLFVIQSLADWNSFVAGSFVPGGSFPIPFNPTKQSLVVIATEDPCANLFSIGSICNNGAQVTVQVNEQGVCCPTVPVLQGVVDSTHYMAVIINNGALPVVINHSFFPYIGPLCV